MARPPSAETLLDRHLHRVASALCPDRAQVQEAERRAATLIQELSDGPAWMFQVVRWDPHGSHARDTALVGSSDYDALVVLNRSALRTTRGEDRSASDTLRRMSDAINARRAGLRAQGFLEARPQGHSVGVQYLRSGLHLDLVPVRRWGRGLEIPSRARGEWIATHPGRAVQRLEAATAAVPHARDAVRLVKGWRRARGRNAPLPSYALELLMVERALTDGGTLLELVYDFFADVANHDKRKRIVLRGASDGLPVQVQDPDTGENVTADRTAAHRRTLVESCRRAVDALDEVFGKLKQDPDARVGGALERLFVGRDG